MNLHLGCGDGDLSSTDSGVAQAQIDSLEKSKRVGVINSGCFSQNRHQFWLVPKLDIEAHTFRSSLLHVYASLIDLAAYSWTSNKDEILTRVRSAKCGHI